MPGVSREIARNKRGIWLVEIDLGRPMRFALEAVDIQTRSSGTVRYFAGLADFSLGSSVGAEASVGVTIDAGESVRGDRLNWATLVAKGIDLEERPAVLRRWFPGQLLEEARVWLRGRTTAAEYSGPESPSGRLTISIERRPTKGNTIPSEQERVDATTWPVNGGASIDDAVLGATYPLILGAPGHNPGGAFGDPAVPALYVEVQSAGNDDRLLISTGRIEADAVQLYDETNVPPLRVKRTVKTMTDKLGRTVSYVDLLPPFALNGTEGTKYYVGFQADGGLVYGGGVVDPRTGRLVRGLVDLIEYMLRRNGTAVDYGRMSSLRSRLGTYVFDGFINTPTSPFEWLRREVLPLVNLIEREGELGLYYDHEVWDADETDVTVRFDVDQRAVSMTAPLVLRRQAEIYNQFAIEYAPFLATGRYLRRRILGGDNGIVATLDDPGVGVDSRVVSDLRCSLSQRRYGLRPAPPIRSAVLRDDATALRILRDRAARDALPKRVTQVTGGTDLEWVNEGAIGLLINTEAGLPGNVCRVDNVTVGNGLTVCDLTLLDDPIQSPRSTA